MLGVVELPSRLLSLSCLASERVHRDKECLKLKPLLQTPPQPVLTCAFAIHVLSLRLARTANSLMLHFFGTLANFPSEKDVFPFLFLCNHPEKFLISCCAVPRLFPTSTKQQYFNSHPLSTSHQSGRIGVFSHNLWGTESKVRAAITHTSFMSCLLKDIFCWCEGIFFCSCYWNVTPGRCEGSSHAVMLVHSSLWDKPYSRTSLATVLR